MAVLAANRLKNLARRLLPPVVVDLLRRGRGTQVGFRGHFDNFEDARRAARSNGYQDDSIVDVAVGRTRRLQETVGVDPTSILNASVVQQLAAMCVGLGPGPRVRLRVLDFGGALGVHYFTVGPFLRARGSLEWTICETRAMAEMGQRHFASSELRFAASLHEVVGPFDIVVASGSLQYVDAPGQVLSRLADLSNALVISRLPLTDQNDYVTVQTAPGGARYPAWFFSEREWLRKLTDAGLRVVMRWSGPEDTVISNGRIVIYQGLVATRRDASQGL